MSLGILDTQQSELTRDLLLTHLTGTVMICRLIKYLSSNSTDDIAPLQPQNFAGHSHVVPIELHGHLRLGLLSCWLNRGV